MRFSQRPLAQCGEAHTIVDPTRAGRCMTAIARGARFYPEARRCEDTYFQPGGGG